MELAAVNGHNQEEQPVNIRSWFTAFSGIQKDYNTQVSEKTVGRVTKILFQEFKRTESQILYDPSNVKVRIDPRELHGKGAIRNLFRNIPES